MSEHNPCKYCFAEGPFQGDICYGCLKSRELAQNINSVIADLDRLTHILIHSPTNTEHAWGTRLSQLITDLRTAASPLTDRYSND